LHDEIKRLAFMPFDQVKKIYNADPAKRKTEFQAQPMTLGSDKVSIFQAIEGCHENRFVAFNDIPEVNSKFRQ
jgi:hypothetical protein